MLSSIPYHILVAIGDGRAHGYAIMQEIAERTSGEVQILPGTLYSTIKKLVADRAIEECPPLERPFLLIVSSGSCACLATLTPSVSHSHVRVRCLHSRSFRFAMRIDPRDLFIIASPRNAMRSFFCFFRAILMDGGR